MREYKGLERLQPIMITTDGSKAIFYDIEWKEFRVGNSPDNELEYMSSDRHDTIYGAIDQVHAMGYRIRGIVRKGYSDGKR